MNRAEFRTIAGLALTIREPSDKPEEAEYSRISHLLIVRRDTGAIVATVMCDDLFDPDGNRFDF